MKRENQRLLARIAFFALFVLTPPLDIFRLDLNLGHFIVFGHPWTLGLAAFQSGEIGGGQAALNLLLRGFLPGAALVGVLGFTAWKWGRVYCGWLCPHFSVVETINNLMQRAFGKPTLWERRAPGVAHDRRYALLVAAGVLGFAFLWALTLLTYLLPPRTIYHNLLTAALTRNQMIFLGAATLVFSLEFLLARHLFCRFGCAVGVFQSFVWMANKRAMVVGFDGARAAACIGCAAQGSAHVPYRDVPMPRAQDAQERSARAGRARAADAACDRACPMRLKPRTIKRYKFACTQCGQCLNACETVQRDNPQGTLLHWVAQEAALQMSERDFGRRPGKVARHAGTAGPGPSQLGAL